MSSKEEIEKAKDDLFFFNEGDYITREMSNSAKVLEQYIESLERTIKSMSEEIVHKQDEYCKHYCNALREYNQEVKNIKETNERD